MAKQNGERPNESQALMKKCARCHQTKKCGQFYNDRSRPDGLSTKCKDCDRQQRAVRRKNFRERKAKSVPKISSKLCGKCGQTKPPSDFYVVFSNTDGLSYLCKLCEREKSRAYHKTLSARHVVELAPVAHKRCPVCGEEKDICEFYKAAGKPDGHRTLCKQCDGKRSTEYAKKIADRDFDVIKPEGMKLCCFCHRSLPVAEFNYCRSNADGFANYCRACGIEYKQQHYRERQEEYYYRTTAWKQKHPERERAYRTVQAALNRGEIVRPESCTKCGRRGHIVAHHDEYEDPLDCKWLCLSCSRQVHADKRREERTDEDMGEKL